MKSSEIYPCIYRVVRRIPSGRVATYGQVAELAGLPGYARHVGYALRALKPTSRVPWHRVINSQGRISERPNADAAAIQRQLLEQEDVEFDDRDRVHLSRFQWKPRGRKRSAT